MMQIDRDVDIYTEVYYKELATVIMEAEKSTVYSQQAGDPGEPMV